VVLLGFTAVRCSLTRGVNVDFDVERVILDRSVSASEFLSLLSNLPEELHADILFIREDDSAFLSSTGRGGDRLLYALSPVDVRFYLEMNALVPNQVTPEMSPALPLATVVPIRRFHAA
jgi:hypothetical protein